MVHPIHSFLCSLTFPRVLAGLRAVVVFLLIVGANSAAAQEQVDHRVMDRISRGVTIPGMSHADTRYLEGIQFNPGSLALMDGWEFLAIHSTVFQDRSPAVPGQSGYQLSLGGEFIGPFSIAGQISQYRVDQGFSGENEDLVTSGGMTFGLALGRTLGLGLGWTRYSGGRLDGQDDLSLAGLWRPARWLGLSAGVLHVNETSGEGGSLEQLLTVGAALRPFASHRLSLSADWTGALGNGETTAINSRLSLEPWDGLRLAGGFSASTTPDGEWDLGGNILLGLSLGLLGTEAMAAAHLDASGYQGLSLAAAARSAPQPELIVLRKKLVSIDFPGKMPDSRSGGFFSSPTPSLLDWRLYLHRLARDPDLWGVLLRISSFPADFVVAQELAASLDELKSKGKQVWVYLEDGGNRPVYLASHGSTILVNPGLILLAGGISGTLTYLKDTLALIGVRFQAVAVGKYKSAPDQLTRSSSTQEVVTAHEELLDRIYEDFLEGIAKGRGVDRARAMSWVDAMPIAASDALARGLVDGVEGRTGLNGRIEKKAGGKLTRVKAGPLEPEREDFWGPRVKIAVICVEGLMVPGRSSNFSLFQGRLAGADTIVAALDGAMKDPSVKGILLRVNTGGGHSMAAEVINRKIVEVMQFKPVFVSMGTAAASGGYYLAAPARRIFANSSTMTGSIGTFFSRPVISGLLDKLLVRREHYIRGAHADWMDSDRELSDQELEQIGVQINSINELFLKRIQEGRKISREDLEKAAGGRVWTGAQALEKGLVDQVGGYLETYFALLDHLGYSREEPVELVYLPRQSFFEGLTSGTGLPGMMGLPSGNGDNFIQEIEQVINSLAAPGVWMVTPDSIYPSNPL